MSGLAFMSMFPFASVVEFAVSFDTIGAADGMRRVTVTGIVLLLGTLSYVFLFVEQGGRTR